MKKALFAVAVTLICAAPAVSASLAGNTQTVFNRRFAYRLKPAMPYDQLAGMIGPGQKVGEDRRRGTTDYHWRGGRRSSLDVAVAAGRVVGATVTSPRKQRFALGKNGKPVEL